MTKTMTAFVRILPAIGAEQIVSVPAGAKFLSVSLMQNVPTGIQIAQSLDDPSHWMDPKEAKMMPVLLAEYDPDHEDREERSVFVLSAGTLFESGESKFIGSLPGPEGTPLFVYEKIKVPINNSNHS